MARPCQALARFLLEQHLRCPVLCTGSLWALARGSCCRARTHAVGPAGTAVMLRAGAAWPAGLRCPGAHWCPLLTECKCLAECQCVMHTGIIYRVPATAVLYIFSSRSRSLLWLPNMNCKPGALVRSSLLKSRKSLRELYATS